MLAAMAHPATLNAAGTAHESLRNRPSAWCTARAGRRHHASMRSLPTPSLPTSAALSLTLLLASAMSAPAQAQAAAELTIYRCTDAAGKVMLRDSPCPRGQHQEVRNMRRPQDAASTVPRPRPQTGNETPPAPRPQVLVVSAPQPMYQCVRPDGSSYTSPSAEGNPRWVPLWTLGYPVLRERHVYIPGQARIEVRDGRVGGELRSGELHREVVPTMAGYGAGTWVRDTCHLLPQSQTCAALRDELRALRTRFFNAQPSERDRIRVRERGIEARLANDCTQY